MNLKRERGDKKETVRLQVALPLNEEKKCLASSSSVSELGGPWFKTAPFLRPRPRRASLMTVPPEGLPIVLESVRWPGHFLDYSATYNWRWVTVTEGAPNALCARWVPRYLPDGSGDVVLECLHQPGCFLDASTGRSGKGNVYKTWSEDPTTELWARWHWVDLGSGLFALESRRWPGHFLDASTGRPGRGWVYVTAGPPDSIWARWRWWQAPLVEPGPLARL